MVQPLSPNLLSWKNAETKGPIADLYDVEVDDSTILRLVAGDPLGTGSVVYQGNTYLAAAIARSESAQSLESEIPTLTVSVSNITGVAGGFIEKGEMDGRPVTITRVLLQTLDPADALVETFTIQQHSYNRQQATFALGHTNLFKKRVPWRRTQRTKCGHPYHQRFRPDSPCGYPSDQFSSDTRQDFVVGRRLPEPQLRRHGWLTLNAAAADLWDVDLTVPDALYCEASADNLDWSPGEILAPYAFKEIEGDFDVFTFLEIYDVRAGAFFGLLCQEAGLGQDSWHLVGKAFTAEQEVVMRVRSAVDGVEATAAQVATLGQYLRMERVADTFRAYRSADAETWEMVDERTAAMDQAVRVGLVVGGQSVEQGTVSGSFRLLQFRAGGLATCEQTLDACRLHRNTSRFGAFPGFPRK